jgi:hypothetical protein
MTELKLTDGMQLALEALQDFDGEPTLAQLNEGRETPISSGSLTALVRKELAESYDVEVEIMSVSKVQSYSLTGDEPTDEMKLTDGMRNAYSVLENIEGGATLAELNSVSETPIAVAHLTGLKRHGLATSEKVEVERPTVRKVKAYRLIPQV